MSSPTGQHGQQPETDREHGSVKPNSGDTSVNLTFLFLLIRDTHSSKIFKYTFLITMGRSSIRYTTDTPVSRFLIRNSHIYGDSFMLKVNRSSVLFLLVSTGCCYRQNWIILEQKRLHFCINCPPQMFKLFLQFIIN